MLVKKRIQGEERHVEAKSSDGLEALIQKKGDYFDEFPLSMRATGENSFQSEKEADMLHTAG